MEQPRAAARRRAGAADPADRAGDGHRAHRADRDGLHLLQLALQPGPQVRLAGHHQRRPGGLEHRHHRRRGGRTQLRPGRGARTRRAVRESRRVPRRGPQALGQLGGRRDRRRQGGRRVGRRHEDPPAAPPGDVLQRRGRAQRAPHTTGLPAARAGGLQRGRQGVRGPVRGGGVHRTADHRGRTGLLHRPQVPYRRGRSRPGPHQGAARHRPRHRRHGGRGAGEGTGAGGAHRAPARRGRSGTPAATPRRVTGVGQTAARRSAARVRHRGREEPLHAGRGAGQAGPSHRAAADRTARRRTRSPHLRRHARAGRRRHRDVVHAGSRRRLQHHARGAAVRPRRLRRPRRPDPAHPRSAPHGVRPPPDPARPLRPPRPANQYTRPVHTQPAHA